MGEEEEAEIPENLFPPKSDIEYWQWRFDIAGSALNGLLSGGREGPVEKIAELAVQHADALIAQLSKKE